VICREISRVFHALSPKLLCVSSLGAMSEAGGGLLRGGCPPCQTHLCCIRPPASCRTPQGTEPPPTLFLSRLIIPLRPSSWLRDMVENTIIAGKEGRACVWCVWCVCLCVSACDVCSVYMQAHVYSVCTAHMCGMCVVSMSAFMCVHVHCLMYAWQVLYP
jgi:hypothetical protein